MMIVPSSAGSLVIAAMAALFFIVQVVFSPAPKKSHWNRWAAGISLTVCIFSISMFFQYNFPEGAKNQFCERVQFSCLLFFMYVFSGFTFSYLLIWLLPIWQCQKCREMNNRLKWSIYDRIFQFCFVRDSVMLCHKKKQQLRVLRGFC